MDGDALWNRIGLILARMFGLISCPLLGYTEMSACAAAAAATIADSEIAKQ